MMWIIRQFSAACPPIGVLPGFLQALQLPPAVQLPGSWWLWIVTLWTYVVVSPFISALVTRVYPTTPLIAARTGSSPQMTLYCRIGGDKKWMDGQIDGCIAINTLSLSLCNLAWYVKCIQVPWILSILYYFIQCISIGMFPTIRLYPNHRHQNSWSARTQHGKYDIELQE